MNRTYAINQLISFLLIYDETIDYHRKFENDIYRSEEEELIKVFIYLRIFAFSHKVSDK